MVNQDVVKYLVEGKRRGFSINLLKSKLLEGGFQESDVDEAINYLNAQSLKVPTTTAPSSPFMHRSPDIPPGTAWNAQPAKIEQQPTQEPQIKPTEIKAQPQSIAQTPTTTSLTQPKTQIVVSSREKLGTFKKIGMVIAHPSELFEKTKGEGVWPALKYLWITLLVPFIVLAVLSTLFASFVGLFGGAILSSIGFDSATIFEATGTITLYFALLIITGLAVLIFAIYPLLLIIGTGILHLFVKLYRGEGNYGDTFGATVYANTPQHVFFFILPIASIWSFVLSIFGVAIRHEISKLRAFLAIVTPAIIFALIWAVAFVMLMLISPSSA